MTNSPVVIIARRRKLYTDDQYIKGISIARITERTFLTKEEAIQLANDLLLEANKIE